MPKYKRLLKHKREAKDVYRPYTKNREKEVYTYGDGAVKKVDLLSGRHTTYNRNGRQIKNR